MEGNYFISVSRDYHDTPEHLYSLIGDGTLFEFSGADDVSFDFSENGPFEFVFKDRGRIHGQILKIVTNSKIILEWNVDGFGRKPENGTKVWITILGSEKLATVTIEHREIPTEESASAKKKSWTEILEDIESQVVKV